MKYCGILHGRVCVMFFVCFAVFILMHVHVTLSSVKIAELPYSGEITAYSVETWVFFVIFLLV